MKTFSVCIRLETTNTTLATACLFTAHSLPDSLTQIVNWITQPTKHIMTTCILHNSKKCCF